MFRSDVCACFDLGLMGSSFCGLWNCRSFWVFIRSWVLYRGFRSGSHPIRSLLILSFNFGSVFRSLIFLVNEICLMPGFNINASFCVEPPFDRLKKILSDQVLVKFLIYRFFFVSLE